MKRTKEQKGITLIALIITIVVLMVLAAVAISSIQNDGIIGHAEEAKNKYTEKQQEEQAMLDYYESILAGTNWTQSGNKITRGNQTLQIGQTISYTPDSTNSTTILASDGAAFEKETMYWRVLGVNQYGQLELISTMPTTDTLTLTGKDGCLNGPAVLNTLCNDLYKKDGKTTARSLNVEDINKLANYKPAPGTKYTYKYVSDGPEGAGVYGIESSKNTQSISNWTYTYITEFYSPDWTINASNPGPRELENTCYNYTIAGTNAIPDTMVTPDTTPIKISSLITEGLNADNTAALGTKKTQWLASSCVYANESSADFRVLCVRSGGVSFYDLYICIGGERSISYAARPVVSLKSNVVLQPNTNGILEVQ